jgi:hypothetical protein
MSRRGRRGHGDDPYDVSRDVRIVVEAGAGDRSPGSARIAGSALALLVVVLGAVLVACGAEPEATVEPRSSRAAELVLAGDGELWAVDVASGRARHRVVTELSPGDPMHRVVRRGDQFVVFGFATYTMRDADAPLETLAAESWFYIPSADDDLLVTADPDECDDLVLTDIATGRERRVAPIAPGGCWSIFEAAFSSHGSQLAVSFTRRRGYDVPHELALIDIATTTATPVEGSEVPPGYVLLDWSAAGGHVFITGGERFEERKIVAYRLGDAAARHLDVDVGDFYDKAAR